MNGTGTRPVPVWSGSGLAPKHRPLSGVARQKLGSRLTASRADQEKIDVPRRPIMGESVGTDPNLPNLLQRIHGMDAAPLIA